MKTSEVYLSIQILLGHYWELEWIKVVGHRETPGKPELFATTSKFLDYFDKNTLSDLPEISDVDSL